MDYALCINGGGSLYVLMSFCLIYFGHGTPCPYKKHSALRIKQLSTSHTYMR